jgi:hypothetical protein
MDTARLADLSYNKAERTIELVVPHGTKVREIA